MTHADRLSKYRLSQLEYDRICELLGRDLRDIEWAIFSAMWSEHCSYKSSKVHLRKFGSTLNKTCLAVEGENAGIVDLGRGEKIVFKMESHNHPSFIEPYQGAATGVGGILRDIFTMGARPIAISNYLCFGDPDAPRMKTLVDGVVRGIAGYGNSVGVPTINGQTTFHAGFNQNILVNAMAVGLLTQGQPIALSGAKGVGNLVVYVGAKTGVDGVHGAAMASESFSSASSLKEKKVNVQIGDPFFEKLLIESCLAVIQKNLVVAIQDMGAAGLTSSSFEMAAKGQVGLKIHLDQVPLRNPDMTPEEILLSESQERMLLICEPSKLKELASEFERFDLDAKVIGEVIANPVMQIYWRGELLTDIDPTIPVDHAPKYERPFPAWTSPKKIPQNLPAAKSSAQVWKEALSDLASVNGSSREAIYDQYDQRVGARTAHGAEFDVGILRLPSGRALGLTVGARTKLLLLDARLGSLDAVIYPALQMAVKGIRACALTDCLNFANPEKPEVMSEFVASVDAITAAAKVFGTPVVSGNVSFYNETLGRGIPPTPATGLIGLGEAGVENLPADCFQAAGHAIVVLECHFAAVNLAERSWSGDAPVDHALKFQNEILDVLKTERVYSSQVVGFRGLLGTLLQMSVGDAGVGFQITKASDSFLRSAQQLYKVVLETDATSVEAILGKFTSAGLTAQHVGQTQLRLAEFLSFQAELREISNLYREGLVQHVTSLA